MIEALRRSAAHVLVADIDAPALDAAALHHLSRVLRLRRGQPITVTDGVGRWRSSVFTGDGVELAEEVQTAPRSERLLTVAVAPPKGDRLEWLVAKCTEIGIDRLVLLEADHSVVRWSEERLDRQLERLRRIAIEASMQSRRVWLPEISGSASGGRGVAGVGRRRAGRPAADGQRTRRSPIGPEGGWSSKELEIAASTVSLGPHVLRVETAAVAAAVLMVSLCR